MVDKPLFSERMRRWVAGEAKGGRYHNRMKSILEKRSSGDVTTFRSDTLRLDLDRITNRLTVTAVIAPEDVEPEVVDYNEFKKFVLRERP